MSQIARNRVPGLQENDALLRLNAPGLDVTPPDMSGANSFSALERMIHAGIAGVSTAAQIGLEQRAINDRAARERLALDAQAKKIDEGLGAQHAQQILPDILGKIDRGEIALAPGETPADRANAILADQMQGQNEAFKAGLQNHASPRILTALESQLTQRQARDQQDLMGTLASRAANGDLAGSLAEAAKLLPNTSETQRLDAIALPALKTAAANGDTATFDKFVQQIGPNKLVPEIAHAKATLAAKTADLEQQQQQQALQEVAALDLAGASEDTIKAYADSSKLSPSATLAVRNRYTEIAQRREAETQAMIGQAQAANLNDLRRRVDFGHYAGTPQDLFSELDTRTALPPDNPNFISADHARSILSSLGTAADRNVRLETVTKSLDSVVRTGKPGAQLTGADGPDMLRVLGQQSAIVSGTSDPKTGAFILRSIDRPTDFAKVVRGSNVLPEAAAQLIASGISSPNPDERIAGLTNYAALSLADPGQAASITMQPEDKMRARFVQSRVEDAIAQNPGMLLDDSSLRQIVASVDPAAMRIDPTWAKLPKKDLQAYALGKPDIVTSSGINQEQAIKKAATAVFKDNLRSDRFLESGVARVGISRSTAALKDVPGNVLDVFAENLATEYAAQRSFTPDDTKAAEAAQKTAFAMTVAKFPPQSWGGEMRFMSQGSAAADPEILRADVAKIVGKDVASDLWANYVPEFVTIGNQVGWQFRSKGGNRDGYPVYARNGAAFVVNPYVSDSALANATETHRRIAEELKKRQALAPYEKQSDPFKVVRFGL